MASLGQLQRVRDCTEASSDEAAAAQEASEREEKLLRRLERVDFSHLNALAPEDLAHALKSRQREIRSAHSLLEAARRQWRQAARKLRDSVEEPTGAPLPDSVAVQRLALDAQAFRLNKIMEEHRALEKILGSRQQRPALASTAPADLEDLCAYTPRVHRSQSVGAQMGNVHAALQGTQTLFGGGSTCSLRATAPSQCCTSASLATATAIGAALGDKLAEQVRHRDGPTREYGPRGVKSYSSRSVSSSRRFRAPAGGA